MFWTGSWAMKGCKYKETREDSCFVGLVSWNGWQIFNYIRAERTSNLDLHFSINICSHTTLLLGITSAPSVQWCFCNFFNAWIQQCPDLKLMDEIFAKGHHTVKKDTHREIGAAHGPTWVSRNRWWEKPKPPVGLGMELYAVKMLLDLGFSL